MKTKGIRSYNVSLDGEHWTSVNSVSRGQAKSWFLRYLDSDVDYKKIKCRVGGPVETSEGFIRMAKYRNIEFAYCGMVVRLKDDSREMEGVIVGHNSSSNLDVYFTSGEFKGMTLNCHPHSKITYYNHKGKLVKEF
jgi:hypothetical protein